MKKTVIFILAAVAMIGCGAGGASYQTNEQLGTIPSIYVEHFAKRQALTESGRSGELSQQQWIEQEQELKAELQRAAGEALQQMKGKDVFFSFADGYSDDRFEVESITIDDLINDTGALYFKVKVKALKEMEAGADHLKYLLINDQNQAVGQGTLNPFVKQPIVSSRQIPFGKRIKAGDYCCDQGTALIIYCGSYDFTGFKQIVFIP